jgi:hypothetical protein
VLKISTRADRRVERELAEDLRRVSGKLGILFRLAAAAVSRRRCQRTRSHTTMVLRCCSKTWAMR